MKLPIGLFTFLGVFLMTTESAFAKTKEVIVAVVDTGADLQHPALRNRLWRNPGETGLDSQGRDKATNGIDDDENGYVDDVHGWNFADGGPVPIDRHGHGTHIAGIIAAIAPEAKLMILKYFRSQDNDATAISKTIQSIRYATRMGANLINYSAGGPTHSPSEVAALKAAGLRGILVIAAAGNESSNSDIRRYYPADYGLSHILAVAAIDARRRLLPTSNYGLETVHLAAPGDSIVSTLPDGSYGEMSGTSQATAFASGVAALSLAENRHEPEDLIRHLINTGFKSPTLHGKTRAETVIDVTRSRTIRGHGESIDGARITNSAGIDPVFFSFDTAPEPLTLNSKRP